MSELKTNLSSLFALQNEYITLVEEENPECSETLKFYLELIDELKSSVKKNSIKYARSLVQNEHFQTCLESPNASLYIPVLEFLQMIFRGHKHMASILLKEVPEILLNIMQEISTHLKYGYESLMTHESSHESSERRSRSQGSTDSMECLYSKKEAKSIAEFSAKFIKCAIESDKDVLLFVVLECPMLTEFMSKSSTIMNSRDFSRLAMALIDEEEKLREMELRSAAAVLIQSFWRSILQQRNWTKMRKGFIQLQKAFRKKLQHRETDLWRQFRASERQFNLELNALKERRRFQEKIFESIRQTPSSQLNLLFSREKEAAAVKIQDYWRSHKDSTISAPDDHQDGPDESPKKDPKAEVAAMTIQLAIRRWLHRRRKEHLAKSQPFLNLPITEERAMKLQQEIDAWQHHHKAPPMMSSSDFAELHQKAQLKYAKFCQSLVQSRRREQKTLAIIAQSKNVIEILDNKPDLHSYNPNEDWNKFHSLPLHIATKARMDHNLAMSRLEMPAWQRILDQE